MALLSEWSVLDFIVWSSTSIATERKVVWIHVYGFIPGFSSVDWWLPLIGGDTGTSKHCIGIGQSGGFASSPCGWRSRTDSSALLLFLNENLRNVEISARCTGTQFKCHNCLFFYTQFIWYEFYLSKNFVQYLYLSKLQLSFPRGSGLVPPLVDFNNSRDTLPSARADCLHVFISLSEINVLFIKIPRWIWCTRGHRFDVLCEFMDNFDKHLGVFLNTSYWETQKENVQRSCRKRGFDLGGK